jgi:transcriptional regulator with XRE-family HTH domain
MAICSGDLVMRQKNLKILRGTLTQQELADLLGVSLSTILRLEKGRLKINDRWRDRLSKALKINPQRFDEPQSCVESNNTIVTQNPLERSDAHANLRPVLSLFSKQADSQYKKSAIELVKGFNDLGNLEKLTYEELWDYTKEYLLKIYNVTDDLTYNELILVYSMTNDDSIIKKIFNVCQPSGIHPDPILLNVLGNFSREPLNDYWHNEFKHLEHQIDEYLEYINDSSARTTLVVFALAPQPLVVELGRRLSNIQKVKLYPTFRKNYFEAGWGWYRGQHYISESESRKKLGYEIYKPKNTKGRVVLNLSLSSSILYEEIERVLGSDISVWKLSIEKPDDGCVQNKNHLFAFRKVFRKILTKIMAKHGKGIFLNVFLSVPIIIAFEIGRLWNPDTDPELILFGVSGESGDYYPIYTLSKD